MSSYSRSGHSKYSLKVHLIFVTKYRKPIFCDNDMNTYIKNLFQNISIKHNYKIIQMETDKNHIHILLDFVCSIGQVSQSIIEKYIESQG